MEIKEELIFVPLLGDGGGGNSERTIFGIFNFGLISIFKIFYLFTSNVANALIFLDDWSFCS